jgi:hypothetical protein
MAQAEAAGSARGGDADAVRRVRELEQERDRLAERAALLDVARREAVSEAEGHERALEQVQAEARAAAEQAAAAESERARLAAELQSTRRRSGEPLDPEPAPTPVRVGPSGSNGETVVAERARRAARASEPAAVATRSRAAAPRRAPQAAAARRPAARPAGKRSSLTTFGIVVLVLGLVIAVVRLAGIIRLLVAP